MVYMTKENHSPETPGNDQEQTFNYNPVEDAIDDAQAILRDVEDLADDRFDADVQDLRRRLEDIEDAVDEAQDTGDAAELGLVPAEVNYLQHAASNLAGQVSDGDDRLEDFTVAMEGVEDALSFGDIARTRWFAAVNDVPLVFDDRTVDQAALVRGGLGDDVDVGTYTLEAYTSPVDDDPDARYNRLDQEVDLGDYRHFRTAADKGGGPVCQ